MLNIETVESGFDIWTGMLCGGAAIGLIYTIWELVKMTGKKYVNPNPDPEHDAYAMLNGAGSTATPRQRPAIDPEILEQVKSVKHDPSRRN